jgi:ribosomal protein S18 acetylase RimI-like enzyme
VDREPASIRRYRPDDLDDVYRICLRTADTGGDGTALFRDPKLPGHVYAAPYALFEPSLAFVAEDAAGVGGYIVAALDTQAFEQRLEQEWWPGLRARYPEPSADLGEAISQQERRALGNIHRPFSAPREVAERFPSELHINLLPRLQGHGTGRQLIATLLSGLRDRGSRGVHLLVGGGNKRAQGFYRRMGFTELTATDAHIFGMDLEAPAEQALNEVP